MTRLARRVSAILAGLVVWAACAGPLGAPAKVYRVGWLFGSSPTEVGAQLDAFRAAMRDLGYVDGRNLSVEIRYAEGYTERHAALAAELVALKPDVILVRGLPAALAAKQATRSIPIVLSGVLDPVENGLVASLAHPGGNITGTTRAAEFEQRRLQLLREAIPGATRVGWLYDASNPAQIRAYQLAATAALALGVELLPLEVRAPSDIAPAFDAASRGHVDAMEIGGGGLINSQRTKILDLLAASRMPSMANSDRILVDGGALLFYDENVNEIIRRATTYADRILKGASPADLPIEQPTKFDLIINMRTAKALGLTIPPSVLAQATELVQ